MISGYEIRVARRSDAAAVEGLLADFLGRTAEDVRNRGNSVAEVIGSEAHLLYVAAADGGLYGFVSASFRSVSREALEICEIDELYVCSEARRLGLARRLIQSIEHRAKARPCRRLYVGSNVNRPIGHSFYTSANFEPYGKHFRKILSETE